MFVLAIILALVVLFLINDLWWKRRNLPPGPTPWPLIGNMDILAKHEPGYGAWSSCAKEYGPLFTFWIGSMPLVVLTDYDIMVDTFIKDGQSYAGRVEVPLSTEFRGGHYGIIQTEGDLWQTQRRFALRVFRDFGLGKSLMEKNILVEVDSLVENLRKTKSQEVDLLEHFDLAVGSVINCFLFGYRYDETNKEKFLALKSTLAVLMEENARPAGILLGMFPFLKRFPVFNRSYRGMRTTVDKLFATFGSEIGEHMEKVDYEAEESNDFTEEFLKEMHKNNDVTFSMDQLVNICNDLWVAGMETTSNTMYWAVLYVLHHPQVQKKVHEELDEKIGSDRPISMEDKVNLNYVNATVAEVQRAGNILPINIPHKTTKDVEINGFHLPAGTSIVNQISMALFDEKVFPQPFEFRPERHLDENGDFKKIEQNIPFSVGKRACLGESLARMELFLFFANFFNQFEVVPSDPNSLPSMQKRFNTTLRPLNYNVFLKSRF